MAKDHYFVLGVPHEESARGIRKAFRDLARRHHPDHAGAAGTPMFRDVVDAYRVLSDPQRRRQYDAEIGSRIPVRTSRRPNVQWDPLPDFDHILRNFFWPGAPKSERLEPLLCDVALSPDEAGHGGILPLRIPIGTVCPDCHGARHVFGFACQRCDARGQESSEVTVPLEVPPGVPSGTIFEVPLDHWGISNLWLRVRVFVRE